MPRYFWNALFALCLAACQRHETAPAAGPLLPDSAAIELDTFSRIPVAFADCGCAVATSGFALGERRFVFVHGEAEAVVVMEGRPRRLALERTEAAEAGQQKTFAGDGYRATLCLRPAPEADAPPGRWHGDLKIENRTASLRLEVVGQCGCGG